MKKLKFEHKQVESIVRGEKNSTWRLYDDKDLSVGDDIEFIDKVKSNNPETWRPFGTGRIISIIEKQLGSVDADNELSNRKFDSQELLLKNFRKYYGSNVSSKTTVKIIEFSFVPLGGAVDHFEQNPLNRMLEVKLYADGGSRGNPGPSASGFVLTDMDDNVLVDRGTYLGLTTNNQAEYQALKLGLEEAAKMRVRKVDIFMDSLLVINQMKGLFKVKNRDLWPIYQAIKNQIKSFELVSFTHVPREFNKLADAAVNRALDEAEWASRKMP
jgi:ribonuclease HI